MIDIRSSVQAIVPQACCIEEGIKICSEEYKRCFEIMTTSQDIEEKISASHQRCDVLNRWLALLQLESSLLAPVKVGTPQAVAQV